MSKRKYLVLARSKPSEGGERPSASPERMKEMFAAYEEWKRKFEDSIFDVGTKLKSGGRVVTASGVNDGPFVEAKEVIGGYMILSAESFDAAVEVVKALPGPKGPNVSFEVRELVEM